MSAKFYHCNVCGNVLAAVIPSGVTPSCCDCTMEVLQANSKDVSKERHVPVVKMLDSHTLHIQVGEEMHPMRSDHHICFIVVETECGAIIRYLNVCSMPTATIHCEGTPRAVYAYCNLHGLWRCKITKDE